MPHGKTRIKDVAMLAGVSIGTVDRVLHNRGEVAEDTRIRINKILEETGFSPNMVARALKVKKRLNIVLLLPEPSKNNPYWQKHPEGIKRALRELEMFPVSMNVVSFDINNESDFQLKAESVFSIRPDGIVLAPIFMSESSAFCYRLKNEKIPFVFIDGLIESADYLAYVGENVFQSGRVAGQLTKMISPNDKDHLVVNIARNIQNVHHLSRRAEGFMSYISACKNDNSRIIVTNIPDQTAQAVDTALSREFSENHAIGSVFVTGSRSYLVAEWLKKNVDNPPFIIGYDLLKQNVAYLRSGVIKFLLGQRPEEQIVRGIRKLFDYLYFDKIQGKLEFLPVDIISSENVGFFL